VTIGTVVLLPPVRLPGDQEGPPWRSRREIAAELLAYGINVLVVPDAPNNEPDLDTRNAVAHWVAHIAVSIAKTSPIQPLLLVATGRAASLLPAVGFSQRAARHPVAGYVMIDGILPKAGGSDWPDAPVTYVATQAMDDPACVDAPATMRQAALRGWTVRPDADPVVVLRTLAVE
jgi:hypothetical protein